MQKSLELTKEESDLYTKLIKAGDLEGLFDYGYLIGCERQAKESLRLITNNTQE